MIHVKRVTENQELDVAFTIRKKVFVHEQQVPETEEYDEYDKIAYHYLATINGTPAGAARWRLTNKGIKLERFAVLAEYRNQQIGSAVLKTIIKDVQASNPGSVIYLHAQLPAVNFYKRHGFETAGNMFSECDIQHYKMIYAT